MNHDLYDVLEVGHGASARQIKSAYRRLARAYHPDTNPDAGAAVRFKAVAQAYAVLSDTTRRHAYDRTGQVQPGQPVREEVDESAFE